jgi:hypothetical protein
MKILIVERDSRVLKSMLRLVKSAAIEYDQEEGFVDIADAEVIPRHCHEASRALAAVIEHAPDIVLIGTLGPLAIQDFLACLYEYRENWDRVVVATYAPHPPRGPRFLTRLEIPEFVKRFLI